MILRLLSGVLFPAFALSIAVQYNDPDGWVWMLIYGFPAAIAARGMFGHAEFIALPISGVFWLGAAMLMPWDKLDQVPAYVSAWHMTTPDSEFAREAIGLAICAAYLELVGVTWVLNRRRAAQTAEAA